MSESLNASSSQSQVQQLRVTGRVWVFGHGLTTDDMYPPDAMKLDLPEAAKQVFYNVRPGWTGEVQPGDVVVAGRNFGLGSSRPVAALFRQLGVAALIAEEFNSLFFRNAVNAGLPAMTVPDATEVFHDGDVATIDLATGGWSNQSTEVSGTVPVLPDLVLDIIASGGVLPRLAQQGYLPAELAEILSSPSVAAAGQGSGA
jgi:3-isopropylmalate/(R)-2-methylmalate dehydratase small subunit